MTHFRIIVPSYKSLPWLEKTLNSIQRQTYKDYTVCVIDDASPSERQRDLISNFCSRNRWKKIFNPKNMGALYNIVHGIKLLRPEDSDIIITLDGDDWFYNQHVLSTLAKYYQAQDIHLTYGQYIHYSNWKIGYSKPVTQQIIEQKKYRSIPWSLSHLRTFSYFLWRHIKDEDLRDGSGDYYSAAYDLAIMFPMIEMAGYQFVFINELLLTYNDLNPINMSKICRDRELSVAQKIRSKPTYPTLLKGLCQWNMKTTFSQFKMTYKKMANRLLRKCYLDV